MEDWGKNGAIEFLITQDSVVEGDTVLLVAIERVFTNGERNGVMEVKCDVRRGIVDPAIDPDDFFASSVKLLFTPEVNTRQIAVRSKEFNFLLSPLFLPSFSPLSPLLFLMLQLYSNFQTKKFDKTIL